MTHDTSTAFKLKQEISAQLQILALLGIKYVLWQSVPYFLGFLKAFFVVVVLEITLVFFWQFSWIYTVMTTTHNIGFHSKSAESICHYKYHTGLYTQMKPVFCLSLHKAKLWHESCQKSLQGRIKNLIHWLSCHSQNTIKTSYDPAPVFKWMKN